MVLVFLSQSSARNEYSRENQKRFTTYLDLLILLGAQEFSDSKLKCN